jgi:hypothetical protein
MGHECFALELDILNEHINVVVNLNHVEILSV